MLAGSILGENSGAPLIGGSAGSRYISAVR
jgi:hypothetical protein